MSDEASAWGQGLSGAIQQNKYKRQDAVQAINKAVTRQKEINRVSILVIELEEKYLNNLKRIDPSLTITLSKVEQFEIEKNRVPTSRKIIGAIVGYFASMLILKFLADAGLRGLGQFTPLFILTGPIVGYHFAKKFWKVKDVS